METLDHYYTLSGLPPTDSAPFYQIIGPILLFALAVWNARKRMLTLEPHPGQEHAVRVVTRTFWDLCTDPQI